jgi:hypothetical protein
MSRTTWLRLYLIVSGAVFLFVAAVHLFRLVHHWSVVVDARAIPMWLSYVGLPVSSAYCAWACWLLATERKS